MAEARRVSKPFVRERKKKERDAERASEKRNRERGRASVQFCQPSPRTCKPRRSSEMSIIKWIEDMSHAFRSCGVNSTRSKESKIARDSSDTLEILA